MPNKRFLGLGFTFTATDKGLEKKLTSVSSILSDINEELDQVNSKFGKMNQLFKGSSKKKSGTSSASDRRPSGGRPSKTRQSKLDQVIPVHVMNFSDLKKGTFISGTKSPMKESGPNQRINLEEDDQLHKLSTTSHQVFSDIQKTLGKNNLAFRDSIKDSMFELDSLGNFTEKSILDLHRYAKSSSDSVAKSNKEMSLLGKRIPLVFATIKEYLSDVGENAEHFLSSLGLNIRELIPPQISAAFKLVKSVLAGPAKMMKSLIMKPFEKKQEATKTETDKNIRKILFHSQQTNQKLGRNTKADNIFQKTSDLLDVEKKKQDEKPGVFGKIGDFLKKLLFSPFTLLTAGAGLLWKAFKMLTSPVQTIGKLFNFFKGPLSMASEAFGSLGEILSNVAKPFLEIAAEIAVFGAAIFGFVKGILKTKEEWKSFFTGIFDLGKSIFNLVGAVFNKVVGKIGDIINDFMAAHPAVKGFVDGVSDIAKSIGSGLADAFKNIIDGAIAFGKALFELPVTLIKMIAAGWENIAGWLGVGAGMLGKTFTGLSKTVDEYTKTVQTPMKPSANPSIAQPIAPGLPTPKGVDPTDNRVQGLRDDIALKQQTDQIKNSETQISLMQQQNGILGNMLNYFQNSQGAGADQKVQVNINSDARKQGIFMQKVETEAHGFAGS